MDQTRGIEGAAIRVPMVDPEIVRQIRALHALGWGAKRIARELGIARNSVRRYIRLGEVAEVQTRLAARTLEPAPEKAARALLDGPAAGNAVVVKRLLAEQHDVDVPLRTLQRDLLRIGKRSELPKPQQFGSRRRLGTRCRSISARSGSSSLACERRCNCSLPCSVIPAESSFVRR